MYWRSTASIAPSMERCAIAATLELVIAGQPHWEENSLCNPLLIDVSGWEPCRERYREDVDMRWFHARVVIPWHLDHLERVTPVLSPSEVGAVVGEARPKAILRREEHHPAPQRSWPVGFKGCPVGVEDGRQMAQLVVRDRWN